LFVAALCGVQPISALAEDLTIKLINEGGRAITSITATPVGGGDTATVAAQLQAADSEGGTMTIALEPEQCLFNLKMTFADGTVLDRPDVDLCQAEGLVIE
jgi:hypothetical protein